MDPTGPQDAQRTPTYWRCALAVLALGWGLQLYLIWSTPFAPLVDLPNHMARHYLESYALVGEPLPAPYSLEWHPLPNLGGDFIVPPLMALFDPLVACKLFLSFAVMLYWLGPALFIRQVHGGGTSSLLAALALLPFSFSSHFYWGFLNYYSGIGLAFLVLAHFDWLIKSDRVRPLAIVVHALLVALLFFWHLAPWVVYCVVMGCQLLVNSWMHYRRLGNFRDRLGRGVMLFLPVVPTLALFWFYSRNYGAVNPSASYVWGGAVRKGIVFANLFRSASLAFDLVVVALWLAALVAAYGASLFRVWRWQSIHLSSAALLGMYLVLGQQMGTTADNDSRVLPAALVCLVTALGALPVRRLPVALGLLAVCLAVRYGSVLPIWNEYSRRLEVYDRAIRTLEPGSRVLPIVLVPEQSPRYPEQHFVCWSVPLRKAFVPTLFAYRDQQPLRINVAKHIPYRERNGAIEFDERVVREFYDVVWLDRQDLTKVQIPAQYERLFDEQSLTLWRVK